MAKKIYDAVATIGEYTDKQGQTKKRYMNVGVVMENDSGQLSLKLETIPVGPTWSGWISFYEPKERAALVAPAPAAPAGGFDDDGSIPF